MLPWLVVVLGCYIIAQMLDLFWRTPPAPRPARLWAMFTMIVTGAIALAFLIDAVLRPLVR